MKYNNANVKRWPISEWNVLTMSNFSKEKYHTNCFTKFVGNKLNKWVRNENESENEMGKINIKKQKNNRHLSSFNLRASMPLATFSTAISLICVEIVSFLMLLPFCWLFGWFCWADTESCFFRWSISSCWRYALFAFYL